MISDSLLPYALVGAAVAIGVAGWQGYSKGYDNGANSVRAEWAEADQKALIERERIQDQYKAKEASLLADLVLNQQEAENEKAELSDTANRLRRKLWLLTHKTPDSSASGVSDTTATKPDEPARPICVEGTLHKSVGDDLIREAQRADRYRLLLAECRSVYEKAQSK